MYEDDKVELKRGFSFQITSQDGKSDGRLEGSFCLNEI